MTPREDPASRRTAAIVFAVGVTCALHIGKLPVAIPALQAGLGVSLVQAGFLLSLVQLAGMALGLFVGEQLAPATHGVVQMPHSAFAVQVEAL